MRSYHSIRFDQLPTIHANPALNKHEKYDSILVKNFNTYGLPFPWVKVIHIVGIHDGSLGKFFAVVQLLIIDTARLIHHHSQTPYVREATEALDNTTHAVIPLQEAAWQVLLITYTHLISR